MQKTGKRLSIGLLAALFVLIGMLFAACDSNEQGNVSDPTPSAEQGEYYYDAGSDEYTLVLSLGNTFTLDVEGEDLSGSYTLDGELLTLTSSGEGGKTLSATYHNEVVTLKYSTATYRFLRKIDYTVKFDTAGGSTIADATVVNGKTVTKPNDPTNGEKVFVGWYTDSDFKSMFSFTQPITANLTLYARFIAKLSPEFTVSFDANHAGAETIPAQTTVGHQLFELPTPAAWAGHTFVGWWYSHYDSPDKLTAQYNEDVINEPITLYAVWESDAPVVSVTEKNISWKGLSGNNSYTVSVKDADGLSVVGPLTVATTNYACDFSQLDKGDYTVQVTVSGRTTTVYYKNKALAHVSTFEVQGSKLLFNAVPNATEYFLTVVCGTSAHNAQHTHDHISLGTQTSYDFSECDMMANGIEFTVEATAPDFTSSVSETWRFNRTLDRVTGLTVDPNTDLVKWDPVSGATSYYVTVQYGGREVYADTIGSDPSFDLQYYNSGDYTVSVMPLAFGWTSPAATRTTYSKQHLATPANVRLSASMLEWDSVDGAEGYKVTVDGVSEDVEGTNTYFDLTKYYDASKTSYTITVCALGGDAAHNSLWAPDYVVRNGVMGEIDYQAGYVVWDAVFGVGSYNVRLNDGEPVLVSETSYHMTFLHRGDNTIYVSAVNPDGSASVEKSVSVYVYEIAFDPQDGIEVDPVYRAQGDPFDLPASSRFGFTFQGWYSEPGESGKPMEGNFDSNYDRTFYAKWTPSEHIISFELGEYGDTEAFGDRTSTVKFGDPFTLPVPTSTDVVYAFDGWYSENTQYTNYRGESTRDFLLDNDLTLTAHWIAVLKFTDYKDGYKVDKDSGISHVSEITIPAKYQGKLVNAIGDFKDCTSLTEINIPDTIAEINFGTTNAAFNGCTNLTHVNVYASGETKIDVKYYSVNGVLFYWNSEADGGRMEIKYYPYARQDTVYTIPSTIETQDGNKFVDTIPAGAFYSSDWMDTGPLEAVNIPATVSLIEGLAFYNYNDLHTVNFLPVQEGETEATSLVIRPKAFGDSGLSLARITSIKFPKRLSEDPSEALKDLTYLSYVEVEEGGLFGSIDGLLVLKESEEHYQNELVFYPKNRQLDASGHAVKADSTSMTNRATTFEVPAGITSIGDEAVRDNYSINTIIIPGHVQHIGSRAFQGTTGLKRLLFEGDESDPDLKIEEYAFLGERKTTSSSTYYTIGLTELTLPANLVELGTGAFGSLSGRTVSVSNALHSVTVNVAREKVNFAENAFSGIEVHGSYITTVTFGEKVPYFNVRGVFGESLKTLNIAEGNTAYKQDEYGIVFGAANNDLVFFPSDFEGAYVVPENVTEIQSGMFNGVKGLTSIKIHGGVTLIGAHAFEDCAGLTTVIFDEATEEGAELRILEHAFDGCKVLQNVDFPEHLTFLGSYAFADCDTLTSILLPASLQTLEVQVLTVNGKVYTYGMEVFSDCDNLEKIEIAEGSHYFKFEGGVLYSLRAAVLSPDSDEVVYVPDKAIYTPIDAPEEITVSEYISGVGSYAFGRYDQTEGAKLKIKKLTFKDSVPTYDPETKEIQNPSIDFNPHDGSSTFSPIKYLRSLTELTLPAGMTAMGNYTVYGCSSLQKINVPYTVTTISPSAISGSGTSLTTITFDETPKGVEEVELRIEDSTETKEGSGGNEEPYIYSLFGGMSKITSIEFPARLTYLGSHAFHNQDHGGSGGATQHHSYIQSIKFAKKATLGLELAKNAFAYTDDLETIEFPEGVTELPEYAFRESGITEIVLPDGLETVGDYVFYNGALTQVTFPTTLKSIGKQAFYGTKLTSLTLNEGLETIGQEAFQSIKTLSGTLKIPASVISIGKSAFTGNTAVGSTYFSAIETAEDNHLESIGDSAFSNNTFLTSIKFGKTTTPLTFGSSVFAGDKGLTAFEFPQNVKVIGASLLANLSSLTEVTFADGVSQLESVGELAFSKTGISELSFPESSASNGTALGINLFKSCTAFTTLYLSASITSIDGILGGCASIKHITIDPDSTKFESDPDLPIIYEKLASGDKAIKLVYGELSDENSTFRVAEGGTSIGASAFANQTNLEVVYIPASVMSIGDYAFQNCVNLKQVILADDSVLTSIGKGAFQNCYKLESINLEKAKRLTTLADGVNSYGSFEVNGVARTIVSTTGIFAFAGTQSANPLKITFPQTTTLTKLGKFMFAQSGVTEVDLSGLTALTELPAGASSTSSGGYASGLFSDCTKLTKVTLPSSVEHLGTCTFAGCTALQELDLSNVTSLKFIDSSKKTSIPTSAPSSATYLFRNCTELTKIVFPTSLQSLGSRSFEGCGKLTALEGLDNVTVLGTYAFAGTGITTYDMSKLTTLKTIPNFLFANCLSLASIDFRPLAGLTTIASENMFSGCTGLKSVDLSPLTSLTALPKNMFLNCTGLESVTLPKGDKLKYLGTNTFQYCTSLKKINSAEDVIDLSGLTGLTRFSTGATTNVGTLTNSYLFDGCSSIKAVKFPAGFLQIGGYTFQNCSSLTSIDLTGITTIGQYAFVGSGLASVTIPNSVENIYAAAFSDSPALKTVVFEDGDGICVLTAGTMTSARDGLNKPGVFSRSGVEHVTFGSIVMALPLATFYGCASLQEVTLTEHMSGAMGTDIFAMCTSLKKADLSAFPKAALTDYMFDGCTNLTDVTFGKNLNYLGKYTFRNCSSLQTIDVSNTKLDRFSTSATANVTTTAAYTFDGCVNLKQVITKPGQIKQVAAYTFRNCEKLESFDFSAVTRLGQGAFQNAGLTGTVTLPKGLEAFYMAGTSNYPSPFAGCSKVEKFETEEGAPITVWISGTSASNYVYRDLTAENGVLYLTEGATGAKTFAALPGGAVLESDTIDLNDQAYQDLALVPYLFSYISNVKKVILPNGLTAIPDYLFDGSKVEEVVVPASVTNIGTNAFANTPNLKTVTFLDPEEGEETQSLTLAAGSTAATGTTGVFFGSAIETLTLPDRLAALPTGTFMYTTKLKTLTLPSSITAIPNYCFYGSATTGLQLSDSIQSIGQYAYAYTTGLGDLKAEDFKKLQSINTYVFEHSSVKSMVLPGTIASIGNFAFRYCENLTYFELMDADEGVERNITVNQWFTGGSNLETAIFGEGVTSLTTNVFGKGDCPKLKTLELPDSLTSIGANSLAGTTNVTKLVIGKDSLLTTINFATFGSWTENQTICFENSMSYVGALIGLDWMNGIKANVVFNYDPAAETQP